jgi:hypothetical protein
MLPVCYFSKWLRFTGTPELVYKEHCHTRLSRKILGKCENVNMILC